MTKFKTGDRVRLKARPEIVGKVAPEHLFPHDKVRFDVPALDQDLIDTSRYFNTAGVITSGGGGSSLVGSARRTVRYDVYNRFPEEVELAPEPIKVGDLVHQINASDDDRREVLAIVDHKGVPWAFTVGNGAVPYAYPLGTLVRK